MFLNKHTDSGNSSESVGKKRTRGITKMGDVILLRNQGSKHPVEFSDTGVPLGRIGKKLMSYVGCVVRHHVPIDIKDWRDVPKEMKNNIWDDLSVSKFIIF